MMAQFVRFFSMSLLPRSSSWATTSRPWVRLMSTNPTGKGEDPGANVLKSAKYRPTNMEKKYLVWTGKYKTVEEVPAFVTYDQMERTRNMIRIYGTTLMMIFTLIGSWVMIRSGRKAKDRGESLAKMNIEWHKQQKADHEK